MPTFDLYYYCWVNSINNISKIEKYDQDNNSFTVVITKYVKFNLEQNKKVINNVFNEISKIKSFQLQNNSEILIFWMNFHTIIYIFNEEIKYIIDLNMFKSFNDYYKISDVKKPYLYKFQDHYVQEQHMFHLDNHLLDIDYFKKDNGESLIGFHSTFGGYKGYYYSESKFIGDKIIEKSYHSDYRKLNINDPNDFPEDSKLSYITTYNSDYVIEKKEFFNDTDTSVTYYNDGKESFSKTFDDGKLFSINHYLEYLKNSENKVFDEYHYPNGIFYRNEVMIKQKDNKSYVVNYGEFNRYFPDGKILEKGIYCYNTNRRRTIVYRKDGTKFIDFDSYDKIYTQKLTNKIDFSPILKEKYPGISMIYEFNNNEFDHKYTIRLNYEQSFKIESKYNPRKVRNIIKSENNEFTKELYDEIFDTLSDYEFLFTKIDW